MIPSRAQALDDAEERGGDGAELRGSGPVRNPRLPPIRPVVATQATEPLGEPVCCGRCGVRLSCCWPGKPDPLCVLCWWDLARAEAWLEEAA